MNGRRALAQLPAFSFFAAIAALLVLLGSVAQSADLPAGIWFTQLVLFLLPAVLFTRGSNLRPLRFLRLDVGLSSGVLGLVLLASVANHFFAAAGMGLLDRYLPEGWYRIDAEQILAAEEGIRLTLVLAGVAFLAPLGEEAAFRGYLQRPLMARFGPWGGILVSALLFSALHLDPIGLLPRFELGLFFGWLLWRTGSLWAPILGHAVNNGLAAILFVMGAEPAAAEAQTPPSLRALLTLMGIGLLVLVPTLRAIGQRTRPAPLGEVASDEIADPEREVRYRSNSPESAIVALLMVAAVITFAVAVVLAPPPVPAPSPAPGTAATTEGQPQPRVDEAPGGAPSAGESGPSGAAGTDVPPQADPADAPPPDADPATG